MFISSNLKCFIAVAREGSLKRASEMLFVTSSPISRRIKIFEDRIGYKLFSRADQDLTLTKKGKELYDKVYPYYIEMTELEGLFSKKNNHPRINNNIMIGVENLNHFLFKLFVNKRNKSSQISYISSDISQSLDSLLSENINALISHREITESRIGKINLYTEPVCYLRSAELDNYEVSTMRKKPVLIPNNGFHEEDVKIIQMEIIKQNPTAQFIVVDDLSCYLFLIASGHAVALVGESMAANYTAQCNNVHKLSYVKDISLHELETRIYYLKEHEELIQNGLKKLRIEDVGYKQN